jgi:hypothetical protein
VLSNAPRDVLDDGAHSVPFGGVRAGSRRQTRLDVMDVHRGKAALVVMGIPERELLAAVRGAKGVVDVDDLLPARPDCRAELIDECRSEPRRLDLAGRILQPADRRLGCKRSTALGAAADGQLHQRVMAQPVEVVRPVAQAIAERAITARTSRGGCGSGRGDRVRIGEPPDPQLSRSHAQRWRLVAARKIHCELLAADGWQVEGKQRIVDHGGCGAGLIRKAHRQDNDLLRESRTLRHSRQTPSHD